MEALASQIVAGAVPDSMKGKRILTLDLSGMIAGSKYRGEFEDRMKKLLREVKADGNIILFLDEILDAVALGVLSEDKLISFLQHKPYGLEIIMTGHDISERMLGLADYATEMMKVKQSLNLILMLQELTKQMNGKKN